jgi:putative metalloprotease
MAAAAARPHIRVMLKLTPILLAIGYGLVVWLFSTVRLKHQLNKESQPLADPRLEGVLRRLAETLDLPRVKVNVLEQDAVNGLAAPDGRIFITRGFYDKFRLGEVTAEEMASVVAHELGHVALGHSRRRLIDFSGQNAIRVVLASVLGRFLPFGVGVYVASALANLVASRLSRQDEYEADAYASALMTKAGLGTEAQKSMFRKLEKLTGMAGRAAPPAWLLSHPKTDDRIRAIEMLEQRWQTGG